MPPVEAPAAQTEAQNEPDIAKPLVGIIYPPPEVRNIVDKTASFVARNGPSFEERIRQNEINNAKFNFLTKTDPYHAYYQHKVKEFGEGKAFEPAPAVATGPTRTAPQLAPTVPSAPAIPKEPPPEPEFIADPPSISAFDLDVVKLTAQFVARNGRSFLTTLMNKEQRNYQFDFLRPQHSLFNYFTKLVEQYTKVLIPPKDLMAKLKLESENPKEIVKLVQNRVLWAKHKEQEKRKEQEVKEKERVAYAQIDWHDFVVVETVDYQPSEVGHFPPPTTPDEVGARVLMQERLENEPLQEHQAEMELSDTEDQGAQDMEEDSGDEEEAVAAPPAPEPAPSIQPPLPKSSEPVIVRNYDPKQARTTTAAPTAEQWFISPLTQEKIPAHKLPEHMKISLLDPKWREQKERQLREKSEQENVYATGDNIELNLRGIAERRTDIFGVGVEEAEIGKKIGEEEKAQPDKVVWDGHSASMDKVSQRARENISIEEQIKVIHQTKGLVEDEAKNKIGPSVTRAAPPVSAPPLMSQDTTKPSPQMTATQAMMASMSQQSVPQQQLLRLPPQGVQAPQPIRAPLMMAPRPVVPVMLPARAPQPILPPQPVLGVPLGARFGGAMAPVQLRPVLPPQPVAMADDEPPSKKQKTEESLIPEHQWLAQRPGPVTVHIMCPNLADKPEWNLTGQQITITCAPQETCANIKMKIMDQLNMPVGKQKLQYDGLFIKDNNTLAYYNFMPESVVHLSTKERGGRKK